jgi:hypothetical protein
LNIINSSTLSCPKLHRRVQQKRLRFASHK